MGEVYFVCNGRDCDKCVFDDCVRPERYRAENEIAFDRKGNIVLRPAKQKKPELPLSVYGACKEKITEIQMRIDKLEDEKAELKAFLKSYGVKTK